MPPRERHPSRLEELRGYEGREEKWPERRAATSEQSIVGGRSQQRQMIHAQEDQVSNFSYMRDFGVQVSLPCFGTKCEAP